MNDEKIEYADYPGRTWGQRMDDDYQALLRVARAAGEFQRTVNIVWLDNDDEYFKLSLALAAVDHLL